MIRQFIEDVSWGTLDYLLIDTPPGTSDEHITTVEMLRDLSPPPEGAVLVTTPQGVALSDVRKEIAFCRRASLPILGIVENMSGFVCPHCQECTEIFLSDGGRKLAEAAQVPFLGRIPLDPLLVEAEDNGEDFVASFPHTQTGRAIREAVDALEKEITARSGATAEESSAT